MSWQQPIDYQKRPVAILGAGVLGRRIGMFTDSYVLLAAKTSKHAHGPLVGMKYKSETQAKSSGPNACNMWTKTLQPTRT